MPIRLTLIILSFFALTSCSNASGPRSASDSDRGQTSPAGRHVAPEATTSASPAHVPATPKPPAVIEAIFQDPGDGSASYPVGNGSWATFWFGHAYQVDGKRYYTGFVEQSPDHLGPGAPEDDPPSAKATLTQATFVLRDSSAGWKFVGAQRSIGEVGGRGHADAVDASREPLMQPIARRRLLVAVPTDAAIEQGTVQKNYELLLRTPDGAWSHVGTVNAGHDDSAGCDEGRAFPCTATTGRISFGSGGGDMPAIRVALQPVAPQAPAAQVLTYQFDPATSKYRTP